MSPHPCNLCIERLRPEQYVTALAPVPFGRDAHTHLALINHGGDTRRWYVKLIPHTLLGRGYSPRVA